MDHESATKRLAAEAARIAGLSVTEIRGPVTAVVDCLANIPTQKVSWLWPRKVPLAKLAALAGDPGLGKSVVTLKFAAHVTRGRAWPDGEVCEKGSVVILSAEDDVADTIRPRLEAAGADLTKVHILRAVRRTRPNGETYVDAFSLQRDITALQDMIALLDDARLVIVDPISAYLGSADSHKNAEIRAVLAPLSDLANTLHVTVLTVNHLTKSTGPALYRVIGSIAFTAAARAVWLVARSQDDPAERLLLPAKMNLAPDVEGFTFSLEDRAGVVAVRWGHAVNVAADVILGPETPDERSERAEAIHWLRDRLADGPVLVKKLQEEAKSAGLSWMTVRRAKDALGVDSMKESLGGGWSWALPAQRAHEDAHPSTLLSNEHLRTFEDAHTPEGAHEDAHHSATERLRQNIGKTHEDALSLSKVLTGDIGEGFSRDSEGPGVTCTACAGHYGTYGGWRSHKLRHRCFGRCHRPSEVVQ
jgi:putative DNA primase/helicase